MLNVLFGVSHTQKFRKEPDVVWDPNIVLFYIVSLKLVLPTWYIWSGHNSYVSILRRVGKGQENFILDVEGKGETLGIWSEI